ncbi:MAG: type I DNA topoisomerase [Rhodobiaceae bacterium]|nr:type I DNA topoisomerase [Rhodobiaceae bacterium]
MNIVVVESPAKAKTINKYLGGDYKVLASYGHVRDLPAKDGSVKPDAGFEMEWEVDTKAKKHLSAIADAVKNADRLILATDPDREGEAISWHLLEALRKRRALKKDTPVERVVFNAITQRAVTDAMKNPREIDQPLVDAYLARRALDYLVGFTLSPVLWRKLPGSRSAGRVQSVALRLVVEREMEIERFRAQEYWSIVATFTTPAGETFQARLTVLDGEKLDKFSIGNEDAATKAVAAVEARDFSVSSIEAKPVTRNPYPPFTTSTLQQEASRKLSMSPAETMRSAQKLYEAGHITYMRTDGVDMAPEAVMAAREVIGDMFGKAYVPESLRMYKSKQKNAQEAHECIRPTVMGAAAGSLSGVTPADGKLYDLIWKRSLACQMAAARLERTTVDIASNDRNVGLRATGQVVKFDGFLKVYEESRDDRSGNGEDEDDQNRLPAMAERDALKRGNVEPNQHFTQPPPRYSEAALVKKMEELGIGRPSTYASIISVIQDREYVRKDKGRLVPEEKGRLVTAFLENFFRRYVGYDFTAELEEELDDVSGGRKDWRDLLARFWKDFSVNADETMKLRNAEVIEKVNEALAEHIFPAREDGTDPRLCPKCGKGQLSLKPGKFGAFIGCSNYPDCNYTRQLVVNGDASAAEDNGPRILGQDPDTGEEVSIRTGRFGVYVQLGDGEKPRRSSIPKGWDAAELTLEQALALLSLPREVGAHPETGKPISAGIGRYGPFVLHDGQYANLSSVEEVFSVGLNRAVSALAEKAGKARARTASTIRTLGTFDGVDGAIEVKSGRYGPYVTNGKINATLPKSLEPETISIEEAAALIVKKAEAGGGKKKAGRKKS